MKLNLQFSKYESKNLKDFIGFINNMITDLKKFESENKSAIIVQEIQSQILQIEQADQILNDLRKPLIEISDNLADAIADIIKSYDQKSSATEKFSYSTYSCNNLFVTKGIDPFNTQCTPKKEIFTFILGALKIVDDFISLTSIDNLNGITSSLEQYISDLKNVTYKLNFLTFVQYLCTMDKAYLLARLPLDHLMEFIQNKFFNADNEQVRSPLKDYFHEGVYKKLEDLHGSWEQDLQERELINAQLDSILNARA